MRERFINRQFKDPTAMEALNNISPTENSVVSSPVSQPKIPSGITQTQAALYELNNRYPDERKRGVAYRDPNYVWLRAEILRGNLDVLKDV